MERDVFELAYDGPAVADGTMEVHDFGNALIGAGDMIHEANVLLNGEHADANVRIRAQIRRGSFEVQLLVWTHQVGPELLSGINVADASELLKQLGFAVGGLAGLLKILKTLRGRKETKSAPLPDGGERLEVGEDFIEIGPDTIKLYRNRRIRSAAENLVKPLERDGVERLDIKHGGQVVESIRKNEIPYFLPPPPQLPPGTVPVARREALLQIVKLSFKDGPRWSFFDGAVNFDARIEDDEFRQHVHSRTISFADGDTIRVTLRIESALENGKLRTAYIIERVLQYIPGERSEQPPLV